MINRLWACCVAVFLASAVFADDDIAALLAQAEAQSLDQNQQWRNLLHYRGAGAAAMRSEISPGQFFLSSTGATDPKAELEATITAAAAPVGEDANDHALCRYPARMQFITTQLEWTPDRQPECGDLQRWRRNGDITGVSMVFASGDLGNPASFFGHILMKFNEVDEDITSGEDLDARSVNFGALVPENENPLIYLGRGLLGGYPSSYSSTTYFQQRHDYAESQLRDLWEYRLNLNPAQVALLVDHTWELQDARNTYFFLTRNCAYEFATLLAVVLGQEMLPNTKIWSTPADLFETLSEMQLADGQPVVTDVKLVASRQQDFRQAYGTLNNAERSALRALIGQLSDPQATNRPASFSTLPTHSQAKVLEVALKYARFGREGADPESDDAALAQSLQRQLVLLRLGQPAGTALDAVTSKAEPPHKGHRTSLLQITPLSHSEFGTGLELRLRPAYSDLLSLDAGALPYAGVSMGEVRLMVRDDQVWLRQLDLIRIDAFNVSPTRLPFDQARAWKFRIGAEDRDLSCDDCLVGFAEGAIGQSLALGEQAAAAVFLDVRGVIENDDEARLELGPSIAIVGSVGKAFRISAEAGYLASLGAQETDRFGAGTTMRFGASETWDMRLRAQMLDMQEGETVSEFGFSASFHF